MSRRFGSRLDEHPDGCGVVKFRKVEIKPLQAPPDDKITSGRPLSDDMT